jgi:hypothetical protein
MKNSTLRSASSRELIRTPHEFGNPERSAKGKSVPVLKKPKPRNQKPQTTLKSWIDTMNEPLP